MVPTIQQTMQGPTPQSHMIRAALMQQLSAAEQCVCRRMLGEDVLLRSSGKNDCEPADEHFEKAWTFIKERTVS